MGLKVAVLRYSIAPDEYVWGTHCAVVVHWLTGLRKLQKQLLEGGLDGRKGVVAIGCAV